MLKKELIRITKKKPTVFIEKLWHRIIYSVASSYFPENGSATFSRVYSQISNHQLFFELLKSKLSIY